MPISTVGVNGLSSSGLSASALTTGTMPYAQVPTGSVLQVVYASYSTQATTNSATWVDTGLTATITPRFATSKILIIASQNGVNKWTSDATVGIRLLKSATVLKVIENTAGYTAGSIGNQIGSCMISYLDSPASTSATTYKTQFNNGQNSSAVYIQDTSATSSMTLMEIAG